VVKNAKKAEHKVRDEEMKKLAEDEQREPELDEPVVDQTSIIHSYQEISKHLTDKYKQVSALVKYCLLEVGTPSQSYHQTIWDCHIVPDDYVWPVSSSFREDQIRHHSHTGTELQRAKEDGNDALTSFILQKRE